MNETNMEKVILYQAGPVQSISCSLCSLLLCILLMYKMIVYFNMKVSFKMLGGSCQEIYWHLLPPPHINSCQSSYSPFTRCWCRCKEKINKIELWHYSSYINISMPNKAAHLNSSLVCSYVSISSMQTV